MEVRVLDGHASRVPQTLNGRRKRKRAKRRTAARLPKSARRKAVSGGSQAQERIEKKKEAARKELTLKPGTYTKRMAKKAKRERMEGDLPAGLSLGAKGKNRQAGFSRVFVDNQPTAQPLNGGLVINGSVTLNGFGRRIYTRNDLQGITVTNEFKNILEGYAMGDHEDLEDWNYLLSIEHPETMQGFPNWVINGKGKERRKARKERRRKAKAARVGKRRVKRAAAGGRKQRRKEVKVAKKEERLEKKVRRREGRQKRRDERQAMKKERQAMRQERKAERQRQRTERQRLRSEAKGERGGFFENLSEFAGDVAPEMISAFVGDQDFDDFTISDFGEGMLSQFTDDMSFLPSDEALDEYDEFTDEYGEGGEGGRGVDEEKEGMGMGVVLLGVAALALAAGGKKKKKKR